MRKFHYGVESPPVLFPNEHGVTSITGILCSESSFWNIERAQYSHNSESELCEYNLRPIYDDEFFWLWNTRPTRGTSDFFPKKEANWDRAGRRQKNITKKERKVPWRSDSRGNLYVLWLVQHHAFDVDAECRRKVTIILLPLHDAQGLSTEKATGIHQNVNLFFW